MSGGSYEYLCFQTVGEIIERHDGMANLQRMADRLAGVGYAADAAKETEIVLLTIRQMENRIGTMLERLTEVWRAVEWWDSGDSSEEHLTQALAKYRGETVPDYQNLARVRCRECGAQSLRSIDDESVYRCFSCGRDNGYEIVPDFRGLTAVRCV